MILSKLCLSGFRVKGLSHLLSMLLLPGKIEQQKLIEPNLMQAMFGRLVMTFNDSCCCHQTIKYQSTFHATLRHDKPTPDPPVTCGIPHIHRPRPEVVCRPSNEKISRSAPRLIGLLLSSTAAAAAAGLMFIGAIKRQDIKNLCR